MGRLARCALGRLRLCVIRAHFRLLALEPPSAALCSAGRRGWARRVARPPATLFRKRRFACLCAGPKCNSEAAQALQALAATASGRPLAGWPPRALLGSARLPQASAGWGHHPLELAASATRHHLIVIRLGPPHALWLASSHPLFHPLIHLILPLSSQLHVAVSAFPYTQADRHNQGRTRSTSRFCLPRRRTRSPSSIPLPPSPTLTQRRRRKSPALSKLFHFCHLCRAVSSTASRAPR